MDVRKKEMMELRLGDEAGDKALFDGNLTLRNLGISRK
jgi:hypothetical protein